MSMTLANNGVKIGIIFISAKLLLNNCVGLMGL